MALNYVTLVVLTYVTFQYLQPRPAAARRNCEMHLCTQASLWLSGSLAGSIADGLKKDLDGLPAIVESWAYQEILLG